MLRRWLVVGILLASLGSAAAQQEGCLVLQAGPHTIDQPLTIGPGECMVVGPRAVLVGSGTLDVRGSLTVQGDASGRAEVSVPILVAPGGDANLTAARLWRVNGTALDVRGNAHLQDVLLEGNGVGLQVEDGGVAGATGLTARGHAKAAIRTLPGATARIDASEIADNAMGLDVAGARRLDVTGSRFARNGEHVNASVDDVEGMLLRDDDFGPTHDVNGRPGVVLSAPGPLHRLVGSEANRYHDLSVGLRASGASLTLESQNDTFEKNAVGIDLQSGATVRLHGARLGNGADFQGTGQGEVLLDGVTYLTSAPAPVGPPVWMLVGAPVALMGLAGVLLWRRRRASRALRVPVAVPEPASSEEPAPPTLPARPLSAQERRILEDLQQNPETPQAAMAERLGLSRQALHYHVKKLEARGLLGKTAKGRETLCRLLPEGAAALAASVAPPEEANTI